MKQRALAKSIYSAIFVLIISFFLLISGTASAGDSQKQSGGGVGLRLIPPRGEKSRGYFYFELEPGKSQTRRFELLNRSNSPVTVAIYPGDLITTERGNFSGTNKGQPVNEVGTWIKVDKQIDTISADTNRTYTINFKVPEGTPPGDYLGYVFVQPEADRKPATPDASDRQKTTQPSVALTVVQRFGIVLWARVPGEHKRAVELSDLRKDYSQGILNLSVNIANTGNLLVRASMDWNLFDMEGNLVLEGTRGVRADMVPESSSRVSFPLVSERPIPVGNYFLEIYLRDGLSDYEIDYEFEVPLP
jgi:hypothetical protein